MYFILIGFIRSLESSQTKTFNNRFHHFLRKLSAKSRIARFNSTLLY